MYRSKHFFADDVVCGLFAIVENGSGNGSILLAPQMRHILASLDSVASAADRIQKEA